MGTLIGHAVRAHNYVYLTALVKVMMNMDLKPSPPMITMLDTAAARQPKVRVHHYGGEWLL